MHSCRHAGRLLLVGATGLASAAMLTGPCCGHLPGLDRDAAAESRYLDQ